MDIDDFSYIWTSEKDDYVLVNTEFGFGIVNKKKQMVLSISNDELEIAIIKKMLDEGNKTYEDINEAYADI